MNSIRLLFVRIIISVALPLVSFWRYSRQFDGGYSDTDLLWGAVVAITLAAAIFLYIPAGKKIERFSVAWFIGLFIVVLLVAKGLFMYESEHMPDAYRAWGDYMLFFAIWIPLIHTIAEQWDKPHKPSFFKRVRPLEDAEDAHA